MKSIKIFLSCLVLLSVFASCNREQYQKLVEAESFKEKGGWVVDPQFVEQMGSPYLLAHGLGKPVGNAITEFTIPSGKVPCMGKNQKLGTWKMGSPRQVSVNNKW